MIVSLAAGSTVVVAPLPAWGFSALDTDGFVQKDQLPISPEQLQRALAANLTLGVTWLSYVESAIQNFHADTQDPINQTWNGTFIRADDDAFWKNFLQATLASALGSFSDNQLDDLIYQARTER